MVEKGPGDEVVLSGTKDILAIKLEQMAQGQHPTESNNCFFHHQQITLTTHRHCPKEPVYGLA